MATIFTPSNDYQVIMESLPEFQAEPSGLRRGGGLMTAALCRWRR